MNAIFFSIAAVAGSLDHFGDRLAAAAGSYVAAQQTAPPSPPPFGSFWDGECGDEDLGNPNAEELCDGIDNDCDGLIDEDLDAETYYADLDQDGYGDPDNALEACYAPWGYTEDTSDCDDTDENNHPGADEICDEADNDCDGLVDTDDDDVDLSTGATYFADRDGDGFGNWDDDTFACNQPSGYRTDASDCDDADADTYPGAPELCDEIDNDCDHRIDDGVTPPTWYTDADGDGYGTGRGTDACTQPSGTASSADDCDDSDAAVSPGATEVCDDVDNDCDGETNEDVETTAWYADTDGDGYGAGAATYACAQPSGFVSNSSDCDDDNSSIHPDAAEVCDEADNDCDGDIDEGHETSTWYTDADGDGHGDGDAPVEACAQPAGTVDNTDDPDDGDRAITPEVCDGVDNDGDGDIDEGFDRTTWYVDSDGDGYGDDDSSALACIRPPRHTEQAGDCNDSTAEAYPGALELCDGIDNDCNGEIDTDAPASSYALTYTNSRLMYVDVDTGEVETHSGPYGVNGNSSIAGNPNVGQIYINGSGNKIYEIDPEAQTATHVFTSTSSVCGMALDENGNLFGINGRDRLYYLNLETGSTSVIGDLGQDIKHCGLVYSSRNQALYALNIIPNTTQGWILRVDSETGEAVRVTQLSTDYTWRSAGITYDELNDTIYIVSQPGVFAVDLDPALSGGDNVTLVTDELRTNNLTFYTNGQNASRYYTDADDDGYGDPDDYVDSCDWPEGTVTIPADCDDDDSSAYPFAEELCDGIDNDCDDTIDESHETSTWYTDADGDGHGDGDAPVEACAQPAGTADNTDDCDDTDASISEESSWYADVDDDGYGDPADSTFSCGAPDGFVADDGDCDDTLPSVNPGMEEACDEIDNDCDDIVDEYVTTEVYVDADGDGYGDLSAEACALTDGYAETDDDCDDTDATSHPGAAEVCDEADNDCDGDIDDDDDDVDIMTGSVFFADSDGDGHGRGHSTDACAQPDGYAETDNDCDDTDATSYPGAAEVCDEADNNCDGEADEGVTPTWYVDSDGDGYGSAAGVASCTQPEGYADNADDCNDCSDDVWDSRDDACTDYSECEGYQSAAFCSDETVWITDEDGEVEHAAVALEFVHRAWTTDLPEATWIWSAPLVENPSITETAHFFQAIDLPEDAELIAATLEVAADNTYTFRVNDGDDTAHIGGSSFRRVTEWDITDEMTDEANDFAVSVTNHAGSSNPRSNPAGLAYCVTVEYFGDELDGDESAR